MASEVAKKAPCEFKFAVGESSGSVYDSTGKEVGKFTSDDEKNVRSLGWRELRSEPDLIFAIPEAHRVKAFTMVICSKTRRTITLFFAGADGARVASRSIYLIKDIPLETTLDVQITEPHYLSENRMVIFSFLLKEGEMSIATTPNHVDQYELRPLRDPSDPREHPDWGVPALYRLGGLFMHIVDMKKLVDDTYQIVRGEKHVANLVAAGCLPQPPLFVFGAVVPPTSAKENGST
ncbi:MAG: hypothetical protein Harvfovirus3_65 [Harvfovirus sp.]|uniref:Uncharacterized protein n=1 Tax=Harvfovirus sp. TaxID=2487768 RepID=A0A3G5A0G5_9VIRU|nr:MAG: hypothetical protein Harvfovirus3_65 [Harvfovirus sp.]